MFISSRTCVLLCGHDSDRHRGLAVCEKPRGAHDRAVAGRRRKPPERFHRRLCDRLLGGRVADAVAVGLAAVSCAERRRRCVFTGSGGRKSIRRSAEFDAAETSHHLLTRLPLNEILRLDVTDWMLDVPRLAPALDGLSIVHLSDFHLTGRVGKAYFREVVRASNELQPDLVALTGDLVESKACLDWIPDTFGQLRARYGVYFVLGNHDLRTRDVPRLRRMLEQSGLIDLGGRRRQIEINGQPVVLMGNELPWIKHEPPAACGFAEPGAAACASSCPTVPINSAGPGSKMRT